MWEISVDTHGRAYWSYPSNANPTPFDRQCPAASTEFFSTVWYIYVGQEKFLENQQSLRMYILQATSRFRSPSDPSGVKQQNDGLAGKPIVQANLRTAP